MDVPADRKRSFPPVVDRRTRLLVLGSLPGERSLRAAQYYAHPQNQFWRLMDAVVDADLPNLPYAERLAALLGSAVGLWDVVASAERIGSLDSRIKAPAYNDLARLVADLPSLRIVAFNGAKAASIGRKTLDPSRYRLITLPSSSAAYVLPFAEKLRSWSTLRLLLNDPKSEPESCALPADRALNGERKLSSRTDPPI